MVGAPGGIESKESVFCHLTWSAGCNLHQVCPLIMEKVLVLLLVALAAYAVPDPRGIIIKLDEGELCLNTAQCNSKCCYREDGLSLARWHPRPARTASAPPLRSVGLTTSVPVSGAWPATSTRPSWAPSPTPTLASALISDVPQSKWAHPG